jgi:transcriptional regulator with XRE-family HTH domain
MVGKLDDITDRFIETYESLKKTNRVKSLSDFAEKLNISSSLITEIWKRRSNVGIKAIQNLSASFPHININWLVTGNGRMHEFICPENIHAKNPGAEIAVKQYGVPLIPIDVFAGWGQGEIKIMFDDIQDFYLIPDFSDIDFMIRVKGDSMSPDYNSGDVVACKMITNLSVIQWGKPHVIYLREHGAILKKIYLSNIDTEKIIFRSVNKIEYPEFEAQKNDIINLAMVMGVIRFV